MIYQENVPARVPSQLEPAALTRLVESFKSIKVSPERPLRPGYGMIGTPIKLRTNFFAVRIRKAGPIYDYVVTIEPKTDLRRIRNRLFQLLEQNSRLQPHLSYIAHDSSQRLVSANPLPQPLDIPVQFYDDHQTGPGSNAKVYNVSITLERELDPTDLDKYMEGQRNYRDYDTLPLISALNLALQQHAGRAGVRYGKNRYFFPNLGTKQLGPSIEAVQGFYSSVRPGFKQLLVNVNVCMTAFVKPGNLADKLKEFHRSSRGAMPSLPKSLVRSIHVRTLHLGYKKKLFAIGTSSARNQKFDCAEFGGMISVEQYFLKKYNKKLAHPADLPVVNIGNRDKPNWMPAELCDIENGNVYRDKLNANETAEMIRYACSPPRINAEKIVDQGFPSTGLNPPQSPLAGFGISVDNQLLVVPGRELGAPRLSYKSGQPRVQNGGWNILDVKFQRGASVEGWWVLVVQDNRRRISGPQDPGFRTLINAFKTKMATSGITIPSGDPNLLSPAVLLHPDRDPNRQQSLNVIRDVLKRELQNQKGRKPSFVLVVLENRDNYIYPGIKRIGDVELGIHTIHIQVDKAIVPDPKRQDQYLSNVALKVNTKLGGVNHLLEDKSTQWLKKKTTMMVGIDVTHPGMGTQEGTPSIAAVVASIDDRFVQFPASLRIQKTHHMKEMLDELDEMLIERLNVWEQKNKSLPERILIYRDGVSEGQFDQVVSEELPQVQKAFKKLSHVAGRKEYRPKLSIIICGKRHHAKFWPENSQHADRNGNTRPGTVVDAGITGVFEYDFYLQAHAGLQGHVKATHYTVIYDENNLNANEIQQGTHDTSYLYARATRAVSLIPAAYYADLACERGRCYLNDFLVDSGSTIGGKGLDRNAEKNKVYDAAKKHWGGGLHPDIRGSMFYI